MRHHLGAEGVGVSQRMITQFVKVEQEPLRSDDGCKLFTSLLNEEASPHKNVIHLTSSGLVEQIGTVIVWTCFHLLPAAGGFFFFTKMFGGTKLAYSWNFFAAESPGVSPSGAGRDQNQRERPFFRWPQTLHIMCVLLPSCSHEQHKNVYSLICCPQVATKRSVDAVGTPHAHRCP